MCSVLFALVRCNKITFSISVILSNVCEIFGAGIFTTPTSCSTSGGGNGQRCPAKTQGSTENTIQSIHSSETCCHANKHLHGGRGTELSYIYKSWVTSDRNISDICPTHRTVQIPTKLRQKHSSNIKCNFKRCS